MLEADGRRYVGPGNGLSSSSCAPRRYRRDCWRDRLAPPERLSASFHGRDLFAPVAAMLAGGEPPPPLGRSVLSPRADWPDDLPEIVYIDHYGNAMTGMRAVALAPDAWLIAAGGGAGASPNLCRPCRPGQAFWYENSAMGWPKSRSIRAGRTGARPRDRRCRSRS